MKHEWNAMLATSMLNIDSSRARHPSLHERRKGYTEVWGLHEHIPKNHEKDQPPQRVKRRFHPKSSSSSSSPSPSPSKNTPLVVLTQHRVAHLEQLYLRIFHIPHIVLNSPYVCTESTGPLPYLTDLSCYSNFLIQLLQQQQQQEQQQEQQQQQDSKEEDTQHPIKNPQNPKSNSTTIPPVLVGRNHPKLDMNLTTNDATTNPFGLFQTIHSSSNPIHIYDTSDIITYLRISHHDCHLPIDALSSSSTSKSTSKSTSFQHQSHLHYTLLMDTLQPIVEYLRYRDGNPMEHSLRQMSFQACCPSSPNHTKTKATANKSWTYNTFLHPLAAFQYWATKSIHQRQSKWWWNKAKSHFSNHTIHNDKTSEGGDGGGAGIFINGQRWNQNDHVHDITKLLTIAKQGYACLEEALTHETTQTQFLTLSDTNTTTTTSTIPSHMDVILYAHLCEALIDPDLLLILSACPNLLQFFKEIHERYFGDTYTGHSTSHDDIETDEDEDEDDNDDNEDNDSDSTLWWVAQNNQTNQRNAYHPKSIFSNFDDSSHPFIHDLAKEMATLLLPFTENNEDEQIMMDHDSDDENHNNNGSMENVDEYLRLLPIRQFYSNPANTFHRVRLGGPLYPEPQSNNDANVNDETFDGYLSSKYLKRYKGWYSRYRNKEGDIFDGDTDAHKDSDGNTRGGGAGGGEQWMNDQKKIAMENDQKWMALVAGITGMVFMMASSSNASD